MNESNFLIELGKNGPWAAMACFLLWQLIKERTEDRKQLFDLLTNFKALMEKLANENAELRKEVPEICRYAKGREGKE